VPSGPVSSPPGNTEVAVAAGEAGDLALVVDQRRRVVGADRDIAVEVRQAPGDTASEVFGTQAPRFGDRPLVERVRRPSPATQSLGAGAARRVAVARLDGIDQQFAGLDSRIAHLYAVAERRDGAHGRVAVLGPAGDGEVFEVSGATTGCGQHHHRLGCAVAVEITHDAKPGHQHHARPRCATFHIGFALPDAVVQRDGMILDPRVGGIRQRAQNRWGRCGHERRHGRRDE
jgi:hypothetical protein